MVVLLIGMRVNRLWAVHQWVPVMLAMPRMLAELRRDSGAAGCSSRRAADGLAADVLRRPVLGVQGEAVAYAERARRAATSVAWARLNRKERSGRSAGTWGLWHEAYVGAGGVATRRSTATCRRFGLGGRARCRSGGAAGAVCERRGSRSAVRDALSTVGACGGAAPSTPSRTRAAGGPCRPGTGLPAGVEAARLRRRFGQPVRRRASDRRAAASMTAWACMRPGWRVRRSMGPETETAATTRLEGPRTGAETDATPGSRSPMDWAQPRRRTPDRAVAVKRAPWRPRCSRSGSSQAIRIWAEEPAFIGERGADRHGVPQSGQPFRRGDADAHVALAAVELRALARHVAQVREHRAGGGQQAVLARGRGQLGEPGAEDETALHVARDHTVVFQSHGQAVGRGSCESGGRDQPGEGGRTGLQSAQDQGCLVQNADAARVVHETILASHSVKRKFIFPWTRNPWRGGAYQGRRGARGRDRTGAATRSLVGPVHDAGRRESDG